jgi:hypothetical protein
MDNNKITEKKLTELFSAFIGRDIGMKDIDVPKDDSPILDTLQRIAKANKIELVYDFTDRFNEGARFDAGIVPYALDKEPNERRVTMHTFQSVNGALVGYIKFEIEGFTKGNARLISSKNLGG